MKTILVFEMPEELLLSNNNFCSLKKEIPNQNFLLALRGQGAHTHYTLEKTLRINSEQIDGLIYNNGYGDLAKELNNEFYKEGVDKIKEISKKYKFPILVIESPMQNNTEEYELMKKQGIIKDHSTPFGPKGTFNPTIKQFIDSLG